MLRRSSLSCEEVLGVTFSGTFLFLVFGLLLVVLHELVKIELRSLEDLDLSDEDVFKGEDLSALLGNLGGEFFLNAK